MSYRTDDHPAVQEAKARRDEAEEAMRKARHAAEEAIERARSLKAEATDAAKDGRDDDAEALLDEAMDEKRTAEKKAAIADAREEMAEEAEHTFRATIDKAKQELRQEAKAERGEKLRAAVDAYADFAEKMEAARAIDRTFAGLAGSSAAKVVPEIKAQDRAGRTRSLDAIVKKLQEQAESDVRATA